MSKPNTNLQKLANEIRTLRKSRNQSQSEFGNLFDPPASKSIVSKWESGATEPSKVRLEQLSLLANKPVQSLLYGTLKESVEDAFNAVMYAIKYENILTDTRSYVTGNLSPDEDRYRKNIVSIASDLVQEIPSYNNVQKLPPITIEKIQSKLVKSTTAIAHTLHIKPSDKEIIMSLLADEAHRMGNGETRTNDGLLNIVSRGLATIDLDIFNLETVAVLPDDGPAKAVTLPTTIDPEVSEKVQQILTEAKAQIKNLYTGMSYF